MPVGIDIDGFPPIGTRLIPGKSILYVYTHCETMQTTAVRYKDGEQIAYVEAISLNGSWSKVCFASLVCATLRSLVGFHHIDKNKLFQWFLTTFRHA